MPVTSMGSWQEKEMWEEMDTSEKSLAYMKMSIFVQNVGSIAMTSLHSLEAEAKVYGKVDK